MTLEPKSTRHRIGLFARGDAVVSLRELCAWVEASERAGEWLEPRLFKERDAAPPPTAAA
jgi:hypothetical protein